MYKELMATESIVHTGTLSQGNKKDHCTVPAYCTFLHFVTEQKDFIPSFAASRVAVDTADLQLSCVWGPCDTEKA